MGLLPLTHCHLQHKVEQLRLVPANNIEVAFYHHTIQDGSPNPLEHSY